LSCVEWKMIGKQRTNVMQKTSKKIIRGGVL